MERINAIKSRCVWIRLEAELNDPKRATGGAIIQKKMHEEKTDEGVISGQGSKRYTKSAFRRGSFGVEVQTVSELTPPGTCPWNHSVEMVHVVH